MMHQRKLIRDAVKERLLFKTAAQDRVFATRMVPYRRVELPALAIYALTEPVDPASRNTAPRRLTRNLQLVIEAAVQAEEDVDDVLDALALEIERAMDADLYFGDTASGSILAGTDLTVVTDVNGRALDQPLGLATLTYAVTYYTDVLVAEDVPLDDLKTVDAKFSVGGNVNPNNQAEDKLTGLELGS